MNHKRIAHQILARLPTHVNNVSVRYIDSLVRQYARNKKDFSAIKRIINQNERRHLIMVKTVQDNTINIFDNQIYDKGVKAKEIKQKYHQLTNRIKQLNSKITHYQNNDEFAEATKLKSLQSDLEQELIEVDEQLNSSDYKVTEEEFDQFYKAYNKEMTGFKDEHQKLAKRCRINCKML